MIRLAKPTDEREWRTAASIIIRMNLKLAGMDYGDLSKALQEIGIEEAPKGISSKLIRGSFSAAFFLQALSVIGVEQIDIPGPNRPARSDRSDDRGGSEAE